MAQKYLAFPIPTDLEERVQTTIQLIKEADNKRQHALKLFQIINDLSEIGLNYFFVETLKRANLGRIKLIAVRNAIKVGKKAIMTVGKGIIKSMNNQQLETIATVLEESILQKKEEAVNV